MKKKQGKAISIYDVAEEASVSIATVSRVLNGSSKVKPATQKHVMNIASRLGYVLSERRPGPCPGKPVRRKKVALILFVDRYHIDAETPSVFSVLHQGAKDGSDERHILVKPYTLNAANPLPDEIMSGNYDGFLLLGDRPCTSSESFLRTRPCCWVMNNPWNPTWGDHVMPDHREVGIMAAQYLQTHKCKNPAIVKLGVMDRVQALREEGFAYAFKQLGIKCRKWTAKGKLIEEVRPVPEVVFIDEMIEAIKKMPVRPDGFFMDSDKTLALLYPVMVREKLIIPGQTVLIGCNNQTYCLKGIKPYPATIDVHYDVVGRLGAMQVIWRMRNMEILQRVRTLISPSLVALS